MTGFRATPTGTNQEARAQASAVTKKSAAASWRRAKPELLHLQQYYGIDRAGDAIRAYITDPYIVIYEVVGDTVEIRRIYHQKEDYIRDILIIEP